MPEKIYTVDDYINSFPAEVRRSLEQVRRAIKSAAPKAVEKISYKIPVYRYNGDLIAIAAFKSHCSLITMSSAVVKNHKSELLQFKISGTTIHFTYENLLPVSLIKKIVKERIEENKLKQRKLNSIKEKKRQLQRIFY